MENAPAQLILNDMAQTFDVTSPDSLIRAAKVIQDGGVVVYPTDTLYGLGVDARDDDAILRLSRMKGREGPWSVAVADMEMLKQYAHVPAGREEFIQSHLPGKVTVILPAVQSSLSQMVQSDLQTVDIRTPDHFFVIELVRRLDFPITSTSVNRTAEPPLNDPGTIIELFGAEVDLIIDAGILPPSAGSRIYDLSGETIKTVRNSHES